MASGLFRAELDQRKDRGVREAERLGLAEADDGEHAVLPKARQIIEKSFLRVEVVLAERVGSGGEVLLRVDAAQLDQVVACAPCSVSEASPVALD